MQCATNFLSVVVLHKNAKKENLITNWALCTYVSCARNLHKAQKKKKTAENKLRENYLSKKNFATKET